MYKNTSSEIPQYYLQPSLYRLHKEAGLQSNFGLDNSSDLIENGFGLYSASGLKKSIGPIKSQYFRIALIRSGSATFHIGLETFKPVRDYIVFGFPGQIFSLVNPTDEFFCYYMLFSE